VASKEAVKAEADSAASQPASRVPYLALLLPTATATATALPHRARRLPPLAAEPCLARDTAESKQRG
jgi:hypothetical protein